MRSIFRIGSLIEARAHLEERRADIEEAVEQVVGVQRGLVTLLRNRSRDLLSLEDDLRELDDQWGEF